MGEVMKKALDLPLNQNTINARFFLISNTVAKNLGLILGEKLSNLFNNPQASNIFFLILTLKKSDTRKKMQDSPSVESYGGACSNKENMTCLHK